MYKNRIKNCLISIVIFLIEVIIALNFHDGFIRSYLGDILVVVLIYFVIKTIITKQVKYLSIYVLIFAIIIEFLQLFDIVHILNLENNKLACIIIGSTFD